MHVRHVIFDLQKSRWHQRETSINISCPVVIWMFATPIQEPYLWAVHTFIAMGMSVHLKTFSDNSVYPHGTTAFIQIEASCHSTFNSLVLWPIITANLLLDRTVEKQSFP